MTCSPEDNGHCTPLYSGVGDLEPTLKAFRRLHPSANFFMWVFSIMSSIYIIFWIIQSLANSHKYKGSTDSNNLRNKLIRCILHQKMLETEEEAQEAVEVSKLIDYNCLKSTAIGINETEQLIETPEPITSDTSNQLTLPVTSDQPTLPVTSDQPTTSDTSDVTNSKGSSSIYFNGLDDTSRAIQKLNNSKKMELKNRLNPNKATEYNFTFDEIMMISDELDKLYEVDLWLYNKIYAIPATINALIHKVGAACIVMTLFIFSYYIIPIWFIRTGIYVEKSKTSFLSEDILDKALAKSNEVAKQVRNAIDNNISQEKINSLENQFHDHRRAYNNLLKVRQNQAVRTDKCENDYACYYKKIVS
ncbi:hypothetical protein NEIRO03_0410 [Nematocida sp. AWRm78]|nr:hypothetical protein NEIRO02_0346 [Nematocida sp. AWRm79]KAI5182759.1 hypothetical protein NEIRO03_0410 [Nematocida sp. AWRm78]